MNRNTPTLTVFTPTYNRAPLLARGYQALCRQTVHDFCWLIIDDGSTDKTAKDVESWIDESSKQIVDGGFEGNSIILPWLSIRYCYKENGGLHTGYNKAVELMESELCVCVDSDDYLPDDGVEKMLKYWEKAKSLGDDVAGVIGLDYDSVTQNPIGGNFIKDGILAHMMDLSIKYDHHGDTKIICRTDLMKTHYPMPVFIGEKNFNPFYYYLKIDREYRFYLVNENLCFVEYQNDGMTRNIFNQFYNSPKSFACLREEYISQKRLPLLFRWKHSIYFCSSIIFSGEYNRMFKRPAPVMKCLSFPLGLLFSSIVLVKKSR